MTRLRRIRPWTVLAVSIAFGSLSLVGCGLTKPVYVQPEFAPPPALEGAPELVVPPAVDARRFTSASNRAPVPSVQGDPEDRALTARTFGRRLASTGLLATNVTLAPGESVADWVRQSVVDGLRRGGIAAAPSYTTAAEAGGATATAEPPELSVQVIAFWLDVKPGPGLVAVEYRAEVELTGDWPRFREGRTVRTQGTVSSPALNTVLWRRAFDRALAEIAARTADAAQPGHAGAVAHDR